MREQWGPFRSAAERHPDAMEREVRLLQRAPEAKKEYGWLGDWTELFGAAARSPVPIARSLKEGRRRDRIVARRVGTSAGLQNQRSAGSIPAATARIESLFIESFFNGPFAVERSKRVSAANDSMINEK